VTVLVSNSVFIAIFTLFPLNIGRLVLICDGMVGSYSSRLLRDASNNYTTLVVGYATIVVGLMSYVLSTMYQSNKRRQPLLPIIKQLMSLLKCAAFPPFVREILAKPLATRLVRVCFTLDGYLPHIARGTRDQAGRNLCLGWNAGVRTRLLR
jgi:hypothetical protein